MAWVYILKSQTANRFYIGSTSDLKRRLAQHRNGHTQTTRNMGDFTVVLSQEFPTLQIARAIERRLKNLKRKDYIQKIVLAQEIRMQSDEQPRRSGRKN